MMIEAISCSLKNIRGDILVGQSSYKFVTVTRVRVSVIVKHASHNHVGSVPIPTIWKGTRAGETYTGG